MGMLVRALRPSGSTGAGGVPAIGVTQSVTGTEKAMSLSVPATISDGELMLLLVGCHGICDTPSGWNLEQVPTSPDSEGNCYLFSKIKSGDSVVPLSFVKLGSKVASVVGIKNSITVHKNATPFTTPIDKPGVTAPSVTTTAPSTLSIWFAYTRSTIGPGLSWTAGRQIVVNAVGPELYGFSGAFSAVSKMQEVAGPSEATKVFAPEMRVYGCVATVSIGS